MPKTLVLILFWITAAPGTILAFVLLKMFRRSTGSEGDMIAFNLTSFCFGLVIWTGVIALTLFRSYA